VNKQYASTAQLNSQSLFLILQNLCLTPRRYKLPDGVQTGSSRCRHVCILSYNQCLCTKHVAEFIPCPCTLFWRSISCRNRIKIDVWPPGWLFYSVRRLPQQLSCVPNASEQIHYTCNPHCTYFFTHTVRIFCPHCTHSQTQYFNIWSRLRVAPISILWAHQVVMKGCTKLISET
jgi:hypothetical protein